VSLIAEAPAVAKDVKSSRISIGGRRFGVLTSVGIVQKHTALERGARMIEFVELDVRAGELAVNCPDCNNPPGS